MSTSSFLLASLGSSVYSITFCKQWQFNFFFSLDSLYFFFSLVAIARTFKTMLNKSGESGHSCLVPDLRGNTFSFSPLHMVIAVCLSYISLYYVELCTLYAHFLESFDHKWVQSFFKSFFCIYWNGMVFILQFVDMVYHIDWFADVEKSLHPRDESHLSMVYDLSNVLLDMDC